MLLLCSTGYAVDRVYNANPLMGSIIPQTMAFASAMFFNLTWFLVFFKRQQIGWGVVFAAGRMLSGLACVYYFGQTDRLAGRLMIPYFLFYTYTFFLSVEYLLINPSRSGRKAASSNRPKRG